VTQTGATRYATAVRAQGRNLRSSGAAIAARLGEIDLTPWRDGRLGLIGMGASYNAILASLDSYWAAGLRGSPWLGFDLARSGAASNVDAVVGVSQSGRSREVLSCLTTLPADYPKLAVTDDAESPIGIGADTTISLALLEDSDVRTLGYTGTVQALGLLRDSLAPDHAPPDWEWLSDEVDRQVPLAERFAERALTHVREILSFDLVGSGAAFGSAAQGALLLREVCRLPGAAYDTYGYLHGPVEAAGPGVALIVIGGVRETKLAQSLAAAGVKVILLTTEDVREEHGIVVYRLPAADDALRPILEIVPLQTLALALATANGLPVGEFRHHQDDTKVT
jgi:glutamine---fructose-6-phosphate transaminase (isomerizing)